MFEFATATKIIFGRGSLASVPALTASLGTHVLLVTGSSPKRAQPLQEALEAAALQVTVFRVGAEPTIALAEEGATLARAQGCEVVIAFGGGSVLDGGKAIAALATNDGNPLDYLEVIGRGQPLRKDPLPVIAIPTTAGTGAEVTKNAVLKSQQQAVKVSLRHPKMLPAVALVDPALTDALPPDITAATGMDALTQCIEPYVSHAANPLTDVIALEGVRRAARALHHAYADGSNTAARDDMAYASLSGGLALANAKLGAVHGFAGVLGGMYPAPHGAVCAALLPHVMRANIEALRAREPQSPALARYQHLAALLTGRTDAPAEDGAAWVAALVAQLNIPRLGEYGVQPADAARIVEQASRASSMKGNPIVLTAQELTEILSQAI